MTGFSLSSNSGKGMPLPQRILAAAVALALAPAALPAIAPHEALASEAAGAHHHNPAAQEDNANSWRYENGQPIEDDSAIAAQPEEGIDQLAVVDNGGYNAFNWYDAYEEGYCTSDGAYRGIDVSVHNGNIDWQAVKKAGVDFAIIRCGYGNDEREQDDKLWKQNVEGCQAAGINFGVYIYSYAECVDCARSEADHVLRCLSEVSLGSRFRLPVYFDMEDKSTVGCDYAAVAATFCNRIESAGYRAGVYANTSWWNNRLTDPVFGNWNKWVAQYNTWGLGYEGFNPEYDVWQFSSAGSIPGINHKTDLNYSHAPFIMRIDFDDVSPHAWYYDAVGEAKELGYVNGHDGTSLFAPTSNITRAQAVCVLYNMAGQGRALSAAASGSKGRYDAFDDTDPGAFYADALRWARACGIVSGYGGTNEFRPEVPISREQFACMMWNYAKAMGNVDAYNASSSGALSQMPDSAEVSGWACEGVGWAVHNNVMGNGGRIYPQNSITRAEVASMAVNYQPASSTSSR